MNSRTINFGKGNRPSKLRNGWQIGSIAIPIFFSSYAFAAGAIPHFFVDLSALFVASALIAYICFRLGLTPIIGFLIAGVIIGPNALGLVQDRELIDAAAEVGVILLLFTIGIEFSLEKLSRISRLIFIDGGLQTGLSIALTTLILLFFGIPWQAAIFTGFLIALSSTAIIMKLLADKNETGTEAGQASLGILIFQDLAVVAMVLLVPLLGGEGGGFLALIWALTKAALIIAAVLLIARRLMPKVLEMVARTCSPEIFLLSVIAICFGTAYLTGLMGVSLSLGAFLAGLIVSESRFGQQAFSEILPLQIIFSAAFFISVGLLLDLKFLWANLGTVLLALLLVLVLKSVITALSVRLLGYGLGVSVSAGLILAQIGEFSFVLERAGREVGLTPFGLGETGAQAFIACTVLLMGFTPFLASLGKRFELSQIKPETQVTVNEEAHGEELEAELDKLSEHTIIAGYAELGQALADALDLAKLPYAIATLSPTGARQAESKGRLVLRGDYTKGHILNLVGVNRAKLIVIPDDQLDMAHRTISVIKAAGSQANIIVFSPYGGTTHELKAAGADHVVSAEHASSQLLIWNVLNRLQMPTQQALGILENLSEPPLKEGPMISLSKDQLENPKCSHTNQVTVLQEVADLVCPECVALGDRWVHLRMCMTCGHVGCCDSSKNKHATQHYEVTKHPIIRSIEPGETWAWCYEDKTML